MAAKDLQTQQQAKVAPIIEKINKAIQAVGEKEGFTYIYDISQGNILYFNPTQCIDVLPLVKKELGLQ
jgi:outer membrane protein